MNVTFYNTKSDKRVLNKSLTKLVGPLQCAVKEESSMLSPHVTISKNSLTDFSNCNYMYIDEFNRYYYIRDIVRETAGTIVINGEVDPLYSWKSGILNINCVVLRQEFKNSSYFQDKLLLPRVNNKYVYKQVGSLPITAISNILTVDGGK